MTTAFKLTPARARILRAIINGAPVFKEMGGYGSRSFGPDPQGLGCSTDITRIVQPLAGAELIRIAHNHNGWRAAWVATDAGVEALTEYDQKRTLTMPTPQKAAAQNAREAVDRIAAGIKSMDLPIYAKVTVMVFQNGTVINACRGGTFRQAFDLIERCEQTPLTGAVKYQVSACLSVVEATAAGTVAQSGA